MMFFLNIHVHNLTCVKQCTGHDTIHLRHWLHLILFNVQVLLCLLTVIAFALQISSHFPHKVHWLILFPILHRNLCSAFKSSEKSNFPISSPIEDDPPRCLKFKASLFFNQYFCYNFKCKIIALFLLSAIFIEIFVYKLNFLDNMLSASL